MLIFRRLWNETWASADAAAAAERSPWAAAEQSELQSDLNVCVTNKDVACSMQMNNSNNCWPVYTGF